MKVKLVKRKKTVKQKLLQKTTETSKNDNNTINFSTCWMFHLHLQEKKPSKQKPTQPPHLPNFSQICTSKIEAQDEYLEFWSGSHVEVPNVKVH